LSVADVLAVLYGAVLRLDPTSPSWKERDRLIMSKGHAAAVLYAALANAGFFSRERLLEFGQDGSYMAGHVSHYDMAGVEASTGSLGHGLPIGTGMALAARWADSPSRIFVMMSDGELDEGSNWEAVLFAAHHELDNLVAIVDFNKIQSLDRIEQTLRLEPLAAKFRSFGWCAVEVDGHDVGQLWRALTPAPLVPCLPTVVIAHTTKGKGVSFMEDSVLWHYRSPTGDEVSRALEELEGSS
jgi:transketolase